MNDDGGAQQAYAIESDRDRNDQRRQEGVEMARFWLDKDDPQILHVNADAAEARAASDHDPVLLELTFRRLR